MADVGLVAWALPPDLLLRVLQLLPHNELPCTARLVCKEAAQRLSCPEHRTVRLGCPLPPHADGWWRCWQEGVRQLPLQGKLRVLSVAAASECEVNCAVAWRLVEPSLFPELPPTFYAIGMRYASPDPGSSAVLAGHVALLPWLVAHRWPLDVSGTLRAAAQCCDLPTLQEVWRLLAPLCEGSPDPFPDVTGDYMESALLSTTPDAVPKMEWLLQQGCTFDELSRCGVLLEDTRWEGEQVARDTLDRLGWCVQRGCLEPQEALHVALAGLDLGSCQQLQAELRCRTGGGDMLAAAAGSSADAVDKLRWLREGDHGMELVDEWEGEDDAWACAAASASSMEAVHYVMEGMGAGGWEGFVELVQESVLDHPPRARGLPAVRYLAAEGLLTEITATKLVCIAAGMHDTNTLVWLADPRVRAGMLETPHWWNPNEPPLLALMIMSWGPRLGGGSSAVEAECLRTLQLVLGAGMEVGAEGEEVDAAAETGSLAMVRWLVEECGCVVGAAALGKAAASGNEALMEYLAGRGAAYHPSMTAEAAGRGDRGALRLLLDRLGPHTGGAVAGAVEAAAPPPVLEWLLAQGLPFSRGEALSARQSLMSPRQRYVHYQQEVLAWLDVQLAGVLGVGPEVGAAEP